MTALATNPLAPESKSRACNTTAFIIEDDSSLRWMLTQALKTNGVTPIEFGSSERFFEALPKLTLENACLLLDMRLPGMSGLEVQSRLEEQKINLPIIFMSGNSHISEAIAGLKSGAMDFLLKPFDESALIEAIKKATATQAGSLKPNIFRLSTKELLVLDYVAKGWRNEEIAEALGLTVRTIKMHRSNIIHKTGASTITEAALLVMNQKN